MRKLIFWLVLIIGWLVVSATVTVGQTGVRAVVVNEQANVRLLPAIGAEVITTVQAGYVFEIVTGRSPDNQWLRVDFNGGEAWVHTATLTILDGDINVLPVADPRTIPYGGWETPRAGLTNATSDIFGRLPFSGVRVRAGPSTVYPVLANAPRYTVMPLLGRTASNQWIQVNFEGTLGWIIIGVIEIQDGRSFLELPIDGIVADSLPISQPVADDYIATLRLMLARVDLAQPSLDAARASWTDAALAGRVFCHAYPARPSDYNIPNELMAAFYDPLFGLSELFNDAMFNVRHAIDLLIEACNQPGTQNQIGQGTVIGALETIALADQQFLRLREWLNLLIPAGREAGPGECVFSYGGRVEILPVISFGQIVTDQITPKRRATGYCVDLVEGQTIQVESRQLGLSNVQHLIVITPLDNPTAFEATGRPVSEGYTRAGPVNITTTARYLIITADALGSGEVPIEGEFALLVSLLATGSGAQEILVIDPNTGQVQVRFIDPFQQQQGAGACPNIAFTCAQFTTCAQAQACLPLNPSLDPDGDGIPCNCTTGVP